MPRFLPCRAIAAALLACFAAAAGAVDSVSLEAGAGDESTTVVRAGLQWNWDKRWLERGAWHLGGYWDLQLGFWSNTRELVDVGLTPVFRYQRSGSGWNPYVEGAIGFHLLSRKQVSGTRAFGSSFQFGDHVGVGVRSGRNDVSLRLQHLSNGGLRKPNPGINFLLVRYQHAVD